MLRCVRECDIFRKLPPEHREKQAALPEGGFASASRVLAVVLIVVLGTSETSTFLTPVHKQRFRLDMVEPHHAVEPRKLRVLLDVTVHDFPCIDLSLDYQDVMGTRQVDVSTTIFKQRLHPNGTAVETGHLRNEPNAALQGAATNPSIHKNLTGNATCGGCYGALPDGECCNSCSDVLYAYRIKRWALPRIEDIVQCRNDGSSKSAYQPPQIIRLSDYSSDDYLPKFTRIGSLTPSGNEARITTPFKLNWTLEPLRPRPHPVFKEHDLQPLVLNFSNAFRGYDLEDDDLEDEDDDAYTGWFGDFDDSVGGSRQNRSAKKRVWPDCILRNAIIHGFHAGEALMVDLTPHGASSGCWNNDCTWTDKFSCSSTDGCAAVCRKVAACQWWTWGKEDGVSKCWFRTGRHRRGKRYGFSAGSRLCAPNASSTNESGSNASSVNATQLVGNNSEGVALPTGEEPVAPEGQPRRLGSLGDDFDSFNTRPYTINFGPSLHMPMFGMDYHRESDLRREQRGESCRIYGHFDTNKVPGNFHIGTHGATTPSYLSYFDEPSAPAQNMQHTVNRLAFVEVPEGKLLNETQPLDGFESPKAFTFQYYLTVTPATLFVENVSARDRGSVRNGYQFRAGSFVTNELIGPAIFFRLDIDPIRVIYYTEEAAWSRLLVSLCAVVGGSIALCSMLVQLAETAADFMGPTC